MQRTCNTTLLLVLGGALCFFQANRVRYIVIQEMAKVMWNIDVYVAPSLRGNNLLLTNLNGSFLANVTLHTFYAAIGIACIKYREHTRSRCDKGYLNHR